MGLTTSLVPSYASVHFPVFTVEEEARTPRDPLGASPGDIEYDLDPIDLTDLSDPAIRSSALPPPASPSLSSRISVPGRSQP